MAGVAAGCGGAGRVTAAASFTGSSSKFSFYIYFMPHILIDPIGGKYGLSRENFPDNGIMVCQKPGIYACFSRF
jgi:hypothetical protein